MRVGLEVSTGAKEYLYNGKELNTDFGLDMLDYGARWYDPAIGRWHSPDPLAEQYMPYSAYNYVLNNPISNIDPDGREVIIGFNTNEKGCACTEDFLNTINSNLGGQFKVLTEQVYDGEGNVIEGQERLSIVETGGDLSKLSSGQQNFLSAFSDIVNSEGTVNIDLVDGEVGVATGNYATGQIDVADLMQWPQLDSSTDSQDGPTRLGKIMHEVQEQFNKQVVDENRGNNQNGFDNNHESAISYENFVNGNTRFDQTYTKPDGTRHLYKVGDKNKKVISVSKKRIQ